MRVNWGNEGFNCSHYEFQRLLLGGGFDLYKLLNGTAGKSNKYFNLTLIQLAVLFLTRILEFSLYILPSTNCKKSTALQMPRFYLIDATSPVLQTTLHIY